MSSVVTSPPTPPLTEGIIWLWRFVFTPAGNISLESGANDAQFCDDGLLKLVLTIYFIFLKHLIPKLEFDVKESRCTTTFYSFPLFIQSRAMLMSCTTMNLKAKQGRKKGLVALTWQLQKRKLTVTYILSGVESMQMCTGLHRYGMLLVYGTHQPPVHFWFKFREEKKTLNAPKNTFQPDLKSRMATWPK